MAALFALAACNNQYHPLPVIEASDPVTQLNPTKWVANQNDLIWPPPFEAR